jgi:hypothetical protein
MYNNDCIVILHVKDNTQSAIKEMMNKMNKTNEKDEKDE